MECICVYGACFTTEYIESQELNVTIILFMLLVLIGVMFMCMFALMPLNLIKNNVTKSNGLRHRL